MVRLFCDQTKIPFIPKFRTGKTILGLGGQINYLHSIMHNAQGVQIIASKEKHEFVVCRWHICIVISAWMCPNMSDQWSLGLSQWTLCQRSHHSTVTLKIYLQPTKHIFCTVWDSLWHIFDTATRWIYSIYLVWWRSSLMQTIATLQPASDILRVVIIIICDWLQVM